jgi:hypothetical protein
MVSSGLLPRCLTQVAAVQATAVLRASDRPFDAGGNFDAHPE